MYRGWLDASVEAGGVLGRAVRRSGEEVGGAFPTGGSPALFAARWWELSRSQAFLSLEAGLAASVVLGRAAGPVPDEGLRETVIWTTAADLYLGYAALLERGRWFPGEAGEEREHRRGAARALDAASTLGGALIKASQFASSRPDLLPAPYIESLSTLQDSVPPERREAIQAAMTRELGRPAAQVFRETDPNPVAAASIAQVHRARLGDGREVAVKVQYPGVARRIDADLSALESVFEAVARLESGVRLQPIADYLRWTLPLELDFSRELRAMKELRTALRDREDVLVPEPIEELSTGRLLVMEYAPGIKVTDREALLEAGIDPREVARILNDLYADGLFRRGILHADPHPGNLLVQKTGSGPRLVLLDHGLTTELEPSFVAALGGTVRAMRAGDLEGLTGSLGEAGLPVGPETDLDTLLRLVGVLLGGEREESGLDLGRLGRSLGASVGSIPPRLLLVGRAIALLDGITRQLDPEFDALEIVDHYAGNH